MPRYRSHTTTQGRNMAGARALWRATGMTNADFDKPIIAIANSFTQFVPGPVGTESVAATWTTYCPACTGCGEPCSIGSQEPPSRHCALAGISIVRASGTARSESPRVGRAGWPV